MSFKFYKQPDSMDCGPACLKMIAEHYGKTYTLDTLRSYSSIGRQGVSLLGISKAAEKIGMRTLGCPLNYDALKEKAPLPCIVHWNQNHFAVVYKLKRGKVFVADPGKGLLSYTKDDFCRNWCGAKVNEESKGIVLLLEPTPLFYEKEGEAIHKDNKVKFLSDYFLKYKRFFFQLILGLLLGCLLQLVFPFLTQSIVDVGIGHRDISFVWMVLIAQSMLLFSSTIIDFIRRKILLHISTRINISLISDFFIKLMKLPMDFFDTKLIGDLQQRIDDHKRVEHFLTAQTLSLFFSFFSFIVFGVVLLIYSVKIFLIFIIGTILYSLWVLIFLKKRKALDYLYFEKHAINNNMVFQLLSGIQEIKLQGCEQRKRWQWEDTQADLFDVNMQSLSLSQSQEAGSVCINEFKNILVTVIAATSVINNELTLGMMLSIQYIIGQLNSPVNQLVSFVYQWQDVSIGLERMNEIHSLKNEENENRTISSLTDGNIVIKDMSFKYDKLKEDYILKNINLKIPEGKTTAIVGASGSGKTTLIKLLLGYYTPDEGEIMIGDKEFEKFNLEWWRNECGVVMQDGFIFSESIARNIAVSNEDIDFNRLNYAAKTANILDYIESLPLKYDTIIGQNGRGLSQGQKQRILIARAVYKNPNFLFFDEATNSLDANNEKAIVRNMSDFYKGKTVVVVAHRLSTVKDADNIIVLDNGMIAEQGNHDELTKLRGKYFELVKNQLELGN